MKDDLRILHQIAATMPFELQRWRSRRGKLWRIVRAAYNLLLFTYLLFRLNVKCVVFWFAIMNYGPLMAAIAKLLGRRVIIITGGFDVVHLPDIDWGAMKNRWHRRSFGALMRLADSVLPFSENARALILVDQHPKRVVAVYPPIRTTFFVPRPEAIQPRVVTCCYEYDATTIVQKGLNILVQAARQLPDIEFVVIGNAVDEAARSLQRTAPPNVRFTPRIPARSAYRDFLQTCSVYAQLSAHEGFGVSLAEAMACGCMPVVSDRYSLPEVVGECGYIVPYGDAHAAARAIRQALRADAQLRERARAQAVQFDYSIRQRRLVEELAHLIPALNDSLRVVRIELGCGSTGMPGTIGVDRRQTPQTRAVTDVCRACFKSESADEVYSICVLEHLDHPYLLMDEVVRLLKPDGRAILRVPNLGTYSAHLDTTHRFLADFSIWRAIMRGYFEEVKVEPVGTKYYAHRLLWAVNRFLVNTLHFHELAQGWTFVCRKKKASPTRAYIGWWAEDLIDR